MKNFLIFFAALCFCLSAGHAHAASFNADALAWGGGSNIQFTKAKQHAVSVNFVFKWGGHRGGIQKYMVTRTVMPQFGNTGFNAMTGTVIPFNAISDFDPRNWTRRTQVLTLLGIGTALWITDNIRGSHTGRYTAAVSDDDEDSEEDSDEDSDSFPDHCTDGYGSDGEYNKFCY